MSNYANQLMDKVDIEKIMQDEVKDMVKYEDLAKRFKGTPAAKAFKQLAADEGMHHDVLKFLKDSGHVPNQFKSRFVRKDKHWWGIGNPHLILKCDKHGEYSKHHDDPDQECPKCKKTSKTGKKNNPKLKVAASVHYYDSGLTVVKVCGVPLSEVYDERLRKKILDLVG